MTPDQRARLEQAMRAESGSGEFLAIDEGHVKGNMQMKVTGGGHEMNSNTTFTSKWRKSDCGGMQ